MTCLWHSRPLVIALITCASLDSFSSVRSDDHRRDHGLDLEMASSSTNEAGKLLKVYVYPMPSVIMKEEKHIVIRDDSECEELEAGSIAEQECIYGHVQTTGASLGLPYRDIHQFFLGRIFQASLARHPRRTDNPDEADLFFIPSFHFKLGNTAECPTASELVAEMKYLNKENARRHFWLSPRVGWSNDVCPAFNSQPSDSSLAGQLISETTKLALESIDSAPTAVEFTSWQALLETQPGSLSPPSAVNLFSIPYPSVQSGLDAVSMGTFQQVLNERTDRSNLMLAAWGFHPAATPSSERRKKKLRDECTSNSDCMWVSLNGLRNGSSHIVPAMLNSTFCLEPPGDTASRKGMVDAVVLGCIPVLFSSLQVKLWPWHIGPWEDVAVILDSEADDVPAQLRRISNTEVTRLQTNMARVAEKLTYHLPGQVHENDAIETTLAGVWRVSRVSDNSWLAA